ncbi:MAG: VWA domain-containing protein [Anaerolineales bacterium]|nr:VWA domain-containing protein [Anaerolineales bacterium]
MWAFNAGGFQPPKMRKKEDLAILVLDGSGSMAERDVSGKSRADAVEEAVQGFLDDLARGKSSHERWISIITYDDHPIVHTDPVELESLIQGQNAQLPQKLDLLARHGHSTAIGTALRLAMDTAKSWLDGQIRDDIPRYVTICLLSDGAETNDSDPEGAADEIKSKFGSSKGNFNRPEILIATAAYGDGSDVIPFRSVLEKMSTEVGGQYPYFAIAPDGKQVRSWLIASVSSQAMMG